MFDHEDKPPLALRAQRAAQELQEALSVRPATPAPVAGPQPPPAPSTGLPRPLGAPIGPPAGGPGESEHGPVGLGPNQNPSPLQAVPSFKSPPVEAFLQKAVGAQGPVGFARGGRVNFAVK